MQSKLFSIGNKIMYILILVTVIVVGSLTFQKKLTDEAIINSELSQIFSENRKDFDNLIEYDTQKISTSLSVFLSIPGYKDLFIKKDREKLFLESQKIFNELKSKYGITHFYYHNLDSTVFLRVHQKDTFGDKVTRYTFEKAKKTKNFASGLELGKTAFALRVVAPYLKDDKLIGYVEFGEEIDHFIDELKENNSNEYALVVDKNFLNRADWKSVREKMGLKDNWDDQPKYLTVNQITSSFSLQKCFSNSNLVDEIRNTKDIVISDKTLYKKKPYICGGIPLLDASGKTVGAILSLVNIEQFQNVIDTNNRNFILTLIVLILITFSIFGILIRKFITRPIIRLRLGTEIIEKGNLDIKVGTKSVDEIGELSRSFDIMVESIKASRAEIDQKVKSQTSIITEKSKDLEDQQKALMNVLDDVEEEKKKVNLEKIKYEALLGSIGDGIIATDNETKIIVMNKAAENILEWKKEEIIGRKLTDVIPVVDEKGNDIPEDSRPISLAVSTMKLFTTGLNTNYFYVTKSRKKIPVALSASPVIIEGKIIGVIDVFRDVTHDKEVDRMKTEFISLASHQLRTPLSAMKWFLEMLLGGDAGKLTAEQKEMIGNINESNERMIVLVNSLLNISRIESGRIIIDPEPTDLGELVREVLKELDQKIKEKEHHIITSIHSELPKINVDPKLIREVYKNLLTNAIKYTPKKGEISIFVSKKGEEIISQVSDNGYGIPDDEKDKVFDKFYRGTNIVKLETDGTGLGLYLVKAIVESSKGKIWFSSQGGSASGGKSKVGRPASPNSPEASRGGGTTFWFSLPLAGVQPKKGVVTLNS